MDVRDHYKQQLGLALGLAVAFFALGLLTVIVIALWHFITLIAGGIMLIGLGAAGFEMYMRWERHKVDLEARRNRALVVHESEHGYGYVRGGEVIGYSHRIASGAEVYPASLGAGLDQLVPQPPRTPETFGEMVQGGYLGPGLDYVLGFDEESQPIRMPQITAMGVGGFPGVGKTVTVLMLMLETIIKHSGRVRFLVVDPHKHAAGEQALAVRTSELTPFFLTLQDVRTSISPDDQEYHALLDWADQSGPATGAPGLSSVVEGGEELRGWMAIIEMEMNRRLHGKKGDMWVFVYDEFASIMDSPEAKRVSEVMTKMNREARKVEMFALYSSQDWKAVNTGGTNLRNAIPTYVLHGMPESVSELIAPPKASKLTPYLNTGEIVLYNGGRITRGRVPMADAQDALRIAQQYYPRGYVQITEVSDPGGVYRPGSRVFDQEGVTE